MVWDNTLLTERLILRPLVRADAACLSQLGNNEKVALPARIMLPFGIKQAQKWVDKTLILCQKRRYVSRVIVKRVCHTPIGMVNFGLGTKLLRAELGYWLGEDYWGFGYASEAVQAMLGYAFDCLQLVRVYSQVSVSHPVSQRVLEKNGLIREAILLNQPVGPGRRTNIFVYQILRKTALRSS